MALSAALLLGALGESQAALSARVPSWEPVSAAPAVTAARQRLREALQAERAEKPILASIEDLSDELAAKDARLQEVDRLLALGDLFRLRQEEEMLARQVQHNIRHLYTAGWSPVAYWLNVLDARSLQEVGSRRIYLQAVVVGDAERLRQVRAQADLASERSAEIGALRAERDALIQEIDKLSQTLAEQEAARREHLLRERLPLDTFMVVRFRPGTREALAELAGAAAIPGEKPRLVQPVRGDVGRYHTGGNPGVDLRASVGDEVRAPAAGEVIYAGWAADLGRVVILAHPGGLVTLMASLGTVEVSVGQMVQAGDRVGQIGLTGWSLAPHLRLEAWDHGEPVNPLAFF